MLKGQLSRNNSHVVPTWSSNAVVRTEASPTCQFHAHHDHARHPEEQNVMPCLQQGAWVELGHIWGVVGPPHGGEGPDAAAEPGVQDILILAQAHLLAWEALLGLCFRICFALGHYPPAVWHSMMTNKQMECMLCC